MRFRRVLGIALLFALLPVTFTAWVIFPVKAAIIQVPQQYPTIQAAVTAARAGDTIQVAAGTYNENVLVDKQLTIVGDGPLTTTVDGGGKNTVFNIQADGVEIRQLTIRNGGRRYNGINVYYPYGGAIIANNRIRDNQVGVALSESDSNTIENSVLTNNSMYGVSSRDFSSSNTIRNNTVTESAYGIGLSDDSSSQVVNNTISNTSYGVYLAYSNNNNISVNTLSTNSWSIYLTSSNSNIVGNNKISGGSVGIEIMRSQGNSVVNNTVTGASYGIYSGYCGANTFSGNTASINDWGIELYSSTGSTIKENTISTNTWGFYIAENSNGNYIYHNNAFNNIKQVYQDPTSGQNIWSTPSAPYQGNYWSDYKGADDGSGGRQAGDGIGDTLLPWGGVDWYPLMTPWGIINDVAIISVTLSANKVVRGTIVDVTVVAENQGTVNETFEVTAKYENTTLAIFGTIGTQTVTNLPSGEQITLVFHWNTTSLQLNVYFRVKAEASTVPNEIDIADNTYLDGMVKVKLIDDINQDGQVNYIDVVYFIDAYGTSVGQPGYNPNADLNSDGEVGMADAVIFSTHYLD